jgi:hypothetical protein
MAFPKILSKIRDSLFLDFENNKNAIKIIVTYFRWPFVAKENEEFPEFKKNPNFNLYTTFSHSHNTPISYNTPSGPLVS